MIRARPVDQWSEADRLAWLAALKPRAGWRPGGKAAALRPATRNKLERRYGYFLTWLQQTGRFVETGAYHAFVEPETVTAYVAAVSVEWAPVTVLTAVSCLHEIRLYLCPLAAADFGWLRDMVLDIEAVAEPSIRRSYVSSAPLLSLGFRLFREGANNPDIESRDAAKLIRDGLIFCLLTICPIRSGLYAMLELGRSIQKIDGVWWICLPASETKTHKLDLRPIPDWLAPLIETYLTRSRPVLLRVANKPGKKATKVAEGEPPWNATEYMVEAIDTSDLRGPFWISCYGRPLRQLAVHDIITSLSQERLGVRVIPHMFRNAAATTAAWAGPDLARVASALLQHSSQETTDHYNRAKGIDASKAYARLSRR